MAFSGRNKASSAIASGIGYVLGSVDLRRWSLRDGIRAALGCGVPLLLAARWSEPGLAWAALIAFWVVPVDPGWPGRRRFATIAAFILASALGAFLAVLLRPYLAAATLFAGLWCFTAVFARVLGSAAASVGGMAAVILLIVIGLQQPSSLAAAWSIAATTLAGGIWGLVLALFLGRRGRASAPPDSAGTRTWSNTLRSNLTWQSLSLRHAARFAIMAAGLTALIRALHLPHSHWVTLAAVIVLQTYPSATWRRAVERLAGTIGGGAIAAAAALFLHGAGSATLLMVPLSLLAMALRSTSYALYVLCVTPLFLVMTELYADGGTFSPGLSLLRMGDNLAGAIIGLLATCLLWPDWQGRGTDPPTAGHVDTGRQAQ